MTSGGQPAKPARDATADLLARGIAATGGGAWTPPAAETLSGIFPGFQVHGLAGRGGMGAVYRAEQTRLGRTVALKILAPDAIKDPLARERFEREARVLSGLNHPHVIQIFDFGALPDGMLYLVTEWAEGGDLAQVSQGKPQPLAQVRDWIGQIAAALDAAHAQGVVHRDLKPANVLVRADGRLALADFGLAHARGAGFTTALTMSGVMFGTIDYMAPEQMGDGGPVTRATDVYALGVMTYQLLTGRLPRGVFSKPSRLVGTPVDVDAVIEQALANEMASRPGSAGEFAQALVKAGGRRNTTAAWLWWALAATAGAAVVVGTLVTQTPVVKPAPAESSSTRLEVAAETASIETAPSRVTTAAVKIPAVEETVMVPKTTILPQTTTEPSVAPAQPSVTTTEPPSLEAAVGGTPDPITTPWRWVIADVRPTLHAVSGGWTVRNGELLADAAVCVLRLPVQVPADYRYDVAVEFTRTAGSNSVGVFLVTSAGATVFELDAWSAGLGGIQMIGGEDMRTHGETFPAALRNGERQQVILQVRGDRVSATWNGVPSRTWEMRGRRLEILPLWGAGGDMRVGLCAWKSPTTFHRVAYRASAGR